MTPKAYDEDEIARQRGVLADLPDRELDAPTEYSRVPLQPGDKSKVSFGEIIAGLTLLYACSISSFNAGYFGQTRGHFVEFFTLADLVGTNISILQYFIGLFSIYFFIATYIDFLGSIFGRGPTDALRQTAESLAIKHHHSVGRFWTAYVILLVMFYGINALYRQFGISNFTLVMLPDFIFQGTLLYFFWVGYKYKLFPVRHLATAALIAMFITSNNAGVAWLKSEIADNSRVQAIMDKDGVCLERNILRNSSSGLLLFNPTMRQFEFRNKDWFRTIFEGRGCL